MKEDIIHPIKIAFEIPIRPDKTIERFVYVYVLEGDPLCLIDTGVAGAEKDIATALQKLDKDLSDIEVILLTHSHPDHIGAAASIQRQSKAQVWAHAGEQAWIEDIERQGCERPVPGFDKLVGGSVTVDRQLTDGDILSLGQGLTLKVLHTPGHSAGSISLYEEETGVLFSGDVIPQPGGMPIYENVTALAHSLVRLAEIENLTTLYSSWDNPVADQDIRAAICSGMQYLKTIHEIVNRIDSQSPKLELMDFCKRCVQALGLPPFATNPLVLRSLLAHKQVALNELDAIFTSSLSGGYNA